LVDKYGLINEGEKITFFNTETKCSPSKARNIGAKKSGGDFLVFIDSDCIAPSFWLEELIKSFTDDKIIAIGGGVKFPENNYWTLADNISMFYSFMTTNPLKYVNKLPSLNLVVRRESFNLVHGFDEKFQFPSGEDFDLTLRLSKHGKLLFNPKAWITHQPPRSTLKDLQRHAYIQGKYSTRIYSDGIITRLIYQPIILFFLAPALSLGVTLKILFINVNLKYFYLFPAILFSKYSWCLGAMSSPWRKNS
jgi:GT2 family glycosyltransferase